MALKEDYWYQWPAAAAGWSLCIAWIYMNIGALGLALGLLSSCLVSSLVVFTLVRLDHRHLTGRRLLTAAFVWGATSAALMSLLSQTLLHAVVEMQYGSGVVAWIRPLVITPVTEEFFKGVFLLWCLCVRKSDISDLLQGIILASVVGAGFAFTEQIFYFGTVTVSYLNTVSSEPGATAKFIASLVLRGLMVPFMHSVFSAYAGLAIAYASSKSRRYEAMLLILGGFIVSITLHGIWDWAGLAASDKFMIIKVYFYLMVPAFVILSILIFNLRRRSYGN